MTLVDDIIEGLDEIRSIPAELGLRPLSAALYTVTWDGGGAGMGSPTLSDPRPLVNSQGQPYHVTRVTTEDIVLSGGLYTAGQLKIGPITPPYAGGPNTFADIDPPVVEGGGVEIYYGITNANDGLGVSFYQKFSTDTAKAMSWYIVLKSTPVKL